MASANLELVRSICQAWECGDFTSTRWADPEIEYVIVDGPQPGSWNGIAQMNRAWRAFVNAWEDFRIAPEEYFELDGQRVLNVGHFSARGKMSGLELDRTQTKGASLFHIRDSKVVRLVIYWNGERALADLGLEAEPRG